MVYTLVAVVVK